MPTRRKKKRLAASFRQEHFCFFCWCKIYGSDSVLFCLDPDSAPWPQYHQRKMYVAAHADCAEEVKEMRETYEEHRYDAESSAPPGEKERKKL